MLLRLPLRRLRVTSPLPPLAWRTAPRRPMTLLSPFLVLPPRAHPREPPAVELTEMEVKVCALLDGCTQYLRRERGIECECRIAGGWVRDKLLGQESEDLDIALTSLTGVTFATHLLEYLQTTEYADKEGGQKIAVIQSNPDQSKHLETARTTLLGLELDFVNLRSEVYAESSRIPTDVTFGTPLEDALRRDIAINALFYNVHTRAVEDHTGNGLRDLRTGRIRTPLPPRDTFRDDPLRVLRCVRFAARFGFRLMREVGEAARDPEIQNNLASKISRERVGVEIDKMIAGPSPLRALQLIHTLNLHTAVFSPPALLAIPKDGLATDPSTSLAAASLLHLLLPSPFSLSQLLPVPPIHPSFLSPPPDRSASARLFLACALTHLSALTLPDPHGSGKGAGKKWKAKPAVELAVRDALKLGTQNHYLDGVPALFKGAEVVRAFVEDGQYPQDEADAAWSEEQLERIRIGTMLREKSVHHPIAGGHWRLTILFALVQALVPLVRVLPPDPSRHMRDDKDPETEQVDIVLEIDGGKAVSTVSRYNSLMERIAALDLSSTPDAKPILDGKHLLSLLPGTSAGPWMTDAMWRLLDWQLAYPGGGREAAAEWVEAEWKAGRIGARDGAGKGARKIKD